VRVFSNFCNVLLNFIYIVYKDARPLYNLGTVGANSCLT